MYTQILFTALFLLTLTTAVNAQNFKQKKSTDTKVHFNNRVSPESAQTVVTYKQAFNGAGLGVGDFNKDGLPDLVFASNYGEDSIYINKGDFVFECIGILPSINNFSTGINIIDINNDGFLDIYVCKSGPVDVAKRKNLLFINQNGKNFVEEGEKWGIADSACSIHSSFFDFDGDGDLDLYVVNHPNPENRRELQNTEDKLFINNGNSSFTVFPNFPIQDKNYGLGIAVADFNWDTRPEIYVTNDFLERDFFFDWDHNDLRESLKSNFQRITQNSMGIDAQDINNDLLIDFVTVDMTAEHNYRNKSTMGSMDPERFYANVSKGEHFQYMYNSLQINMGNNQFRDISFLAGISKTDWSWAPLIADFDLDGMKDIYITNGIYLNNHKDNKKTALYKDGMTPQALHREFLKKYPPEPIDNYYYKNVDGYHFENKTEENNLNIPSFSNGAAYADLDLDGDLDLVVNNLNSEAFIFENSINETKQTNYLNVKLIGPTLNIDGIGTKVLVYTNGTQQLQEFYPSRGYMSSMNTSLTFGLGRSADIDSVVIIWQDKKKETISQVPANHSLTVNYQDAKSTFFIPNHEALFTTSYLKSFKHIENNFNDFKEEILLPYKLSTLGPKLEVGDLNEDGLDDIIIGGAAGQKTGVLIQQSNGSFKNLHFPDIENDSLYEDMDIQIADFNQDGLTDLYIGSGGNEFPSDTVMLEDRLYLNNGKGRLEKLSIPLNKGSNGNVIFVENLFHNQDVYCIISNRLKARSYPFPANSAIYKVENNNFIDLTQDIIPEFIDIGLVTDIELVDINGDDLKDLVISREWQSIMVLINTGDNFILKKNPVLEENTGWWNCIISGDFDNDGDIDFISGNNGENSKYKATKAEPFPIYASDFDESGDIDIVLGYYDEGELYPVRGLQCSSQEVPSVKEEFKDYHHFGSANLEDIYGESLLKSLNYEVSNFSSCVFINNGKGEFSMRKLPIACQFSSINTGVSLDYNNDGNLDLILAGNLLNFEVETPRNDASIGVLLKGNGDGSFDFIPPLESGVNLKNEIKEMTVITIDNVDYIICSTNDDYIQLIRLQK